MDFFFRRKAINAVFEIEDVVHIIKAIALSHPKISFTLRNENNGEKLIQTFATQNIKDAFIHVHDIADYVTFIDLNQKQDSLGLIGFIADKGSQDKRKQYIFVNQRCIRKSWLNRSISKWLQDSMILVPGSSPRKSYYPVFVLFLTCPVTETEMSFEPRKTSVEFQNKEQIMDFIFSTIKSKLGEKSLLKIQDCYSSSDAVELKIPESTIEGVSRLRSASSLAFDRHFSIDSIKGTRKSLPVTRKTSLNLCQNNSSSEASLSSSSFQKSQFEQAKDRALSDATDLTFEDMKEGLDVMKALCFDDYPSTRIKMKTNEETAANPGEQSDTTSSSASGKFSFKAGARSTSDESFSDFDSSTALLTDSTTSTEEDVSEF